MDINEDSAWVFDSLIGFLHGPIWNSPLQTFIEEKSLIFEPTDEGKICDKKEYLAIFSEYKTLVDLMLGSYMDDIGITPDQFETACQMSKDNVDGLPSHFHQRLFEQIWAANDYSVFTRMMTQRNVELQLQALELIEQRSGIVPSSYLPNDERAELDDQDSMIMEEVKKMSLEESDDDISNDRALFNNEEVKNELHKEKRLLKSALVNFQNKILMQEQEMIQRADQSNEGRSSKIGSEVSKNKNIAEISNAQSKPLKEDILQRQQYLKQQRDKLLTLKRQIREKQLLESAGNGAESAARPKSATAAKMMLAGEALNVAKPQDSSLILRKALAERLRSEVVEKS